MNVRWLFAALPATLAGARLVSAAPEQIQIGDLHQRVIAVRGQPTRQINTGTGTLLFYGPIMVAVEGGAVRFLSLASVAPVVSDSTADGVSGMERMTATRATSASGSAARKIGSVGCLEIKLADRLRRVLVMEIYTALAADIGATISGHGRADWDGGSWGRQISLVGIRDAQSCRIERYGEDAEVRDRYVTVEESLEKAWGGGQ